MTLYDRATMEPAGNLTFEESAAHKILTLHALYKGTTYQEAQGTQLDSGLAPLIDVAIIRAAEGTIRLVCRCSFELHPDYETGAGKLWSFVQKFGDAIVPNAYRVD